MLTKDETVRHSGVVIDRVNASVHAHAYELHLASGDQAVAQSRTRYLQRLFPTTRPKPHASPIAVHRCEQEVKEVVGWCGTRSSLAPKKRNVGVCVKTGRGVIHVGNTAVLVAGVAHLEGIGGKGRFGGGPGHGGKLAEGMVKAVGAECGACVLR